MPLSEDEQRILSEIERSFYDSDPSFAQNITKSPTPLGHATRNMRWTALGFVAGLVFLVWALSITPYLSFVGFLAMMASAIIFVNNARRAGRLGLAQFSEKMNERRSSVDLSSARQRIRDRFKRE